MEALAELDQFLTLGTRPDLKLIALQNILGSTAHSNFCKDLTNIKYILIVKSVINLLNDSSDQVVRMCLKILLNLTAEKEACHNLMNHGPCSSMVTFLFNQITDPESSVADKCCKVLNNLTSVGHQPILVYKWFERNKLDLNKLVSSFVIEDFNKKKCNLDFLGRVFGNLAVLPEFRQFLLDKDKCVIQRLVPFIGYSESAMRREGITALVKNCCLADSECHEYLLGQQVDLLPRLLLPLAGGEEFSDEDNERLPVELQYLAADKRREASAPTRRLLLETLLLLVTKKKNRQFIRDSNTYLILRELHRVEADKEVLLACENVVDVLIRTEEEIAEDDLSAVEVPEDMTEKFINMDEEFVKS